MSELNENDFNKLILEAKECPSFISELVDFCYKHDPEQLQEIIKKVKNNSELINVSEIDYDKIKKI